MHPALTCFTGAATPAEFDRPRPERLERGNPLRTTWNHFERDGMSAGTWSCEPGAWRIAFVEGTDEFFHVLAGRLRITDAAGEAREFGPGEACVIPSGFQGLFEVLEPVTKHYVFVRRPGGGT
ncbi:DUF861 domain-containing protein [Pseudothauera nasutitermitis]|uniref:DUF861 domain-containing protein n=1 Tax=Pseudothauera nasutitermitis TaxID=2565930 RepID=A0A4S4B3Z3_9RHOO|nr:cupin domain-containing protein [Pseudothauera nasutitermitis]THF67392.1 DUF861 domain-containing protein [Pseudothauera nasutitermitis]